MSAADWLPDRRLLHLDGTEADKVTLPGPQIDEEHPARLDGVIVCGADAVAAAAGLRLRRPDLVVVAEPEAFASAYATADAPFALPTDQLFPYTLSDSIRDQLLTGAPFALTPSGYVRSTAPEALKAIVEQANEIVTNKLILAVPIEESWLMASRCRQLIAILKRSQHPVVIALGSEKKPLNTERARGLVTLLDSVQGIGIIRADHLVGLEALARSSGPVAFGLIPSRRRITPPNTTGSSHFKYDRRQHVLHPLFHRYLSAPTADQWFTNTPPLPGKAPCCGGRRLIPFDDDPNSKLAAKNHNARTMLMLASRIHGGRAERLAALATMYYDAADRHVDWSSITGQQLNVPDEQQSLAAQGTPQPASARTGSQGTATTAP
jgi:hypothetical protein